ncbi:hypothetical protein BCR42DRAFT_424980 [Absidia repens]|uniref:N-acetyltransferase domain-containing protein n=1 Tax=Absidia repens TaxID=90262 RepID=A0A1X2I361_9FUNG|nr:hypothetical protein BCR42DRAFT_424980 [Absidia repens]
MATNAIYKVIKYQNAKEFLDDTQSDLENDEVINTFPLWICDVKTNSSSQAPQSYCALYENDRLVYVLVCADRNSYVGWYGKQQQHIDLGNANLVDAIKELLQAGVPLTQVSTLHGYSPVVDVFYRIRKTLSPYDLALIDMGANDNDSSTSPPHNVWSYKITNKKDIRWTTQTRQLAQRATLRLAGWMDYPLLVNWSEAFARDCGLSDGDAWNRCAAEVQNGYAYFWCLDDGTPTAMIWKRRALRHGISLAYVYTPKEARGRGYAAAMVAQMTEYLLEKEGYSYITLLVDGRRDPAKNLYTSVGYQMVGSVARFSY